jgi:hypothetical protein
MTYQTYQAIEYTNADDILAAFRERRQRLFGQAPRNVVPVDRVRPPPKVAAPPPPPPPPPTPVISAAALAEIESNRERINEIAKNVAERYGIGSRDLFGRGRQSPVCAARSEWMWLCCKHTSLSYGQVARFCGKRDHTTVIHAVQKMDALRGEDVGALRRLPVPRQ